MSKSSRVAAIAILRTIYTALNSARLFLAEKIGDALVYIIDKIGESAIWIRLMKTWPGRLLASFMVGECIACIMLAIFLLAAKMDLFIHPWVVETSKSWSTTQLLFSGHGELALLKGGWACAILIMFVSTLTFAISIFIIDTVASFYPPKNQKPQRFPTLREIN